MGDTLPFTLRCSRSATRRCPTIVVKLLAGSPGYDHPAFMAELGFWDKYGVKIEFIGGNYIRANNMMSTGDFDVGYNQYANAIRYFQAGIPNVIVGSSSANCAVIIAKPEVKSWADLKGKRIGMVTKFDVQWMTMTDHILPRFGLSEKDVQLALVPVPEVATAILTSDVWAAFPSTYGDRPAEGRQLFAVREGHDRQTKSVGHLTSASHTKKFIKDHPDLAKRVVWAHMDAVEMMRRTEDRDRRIKHWRTWTRLIEDSYDNCGWRTRRSRVWIDTLVAWMKS
jgi:ABC-type nitrate/sulfonate/bicarbonate transport system substrate-binding protein